MSYFIRLIFKQKNTSHTEHVARPHKPNITSVWKDEIHKRIKRGLKVEVLRPVLLAITADAWRRFSVLRLRQKNGAKRLLWAGFLSKSLELSRTNKLSARLL